MNTSRPIPVTTISVLAIITGLYTLATKLLVVTSPVAYRMFSEIAAEINSGALLEIPLELHLAHAFAGSVVWIVAGLFMLRARNWARLLALFWGLGVVVLTLLVVRLSLPFYLKLATWLLMLYFLTRERSNRYFSGTTDTGDA